ncbi:toxic anion resistance protein [Corynebacterium sp. H78]|uniref:toxic anion resistance protein n=1 Tax=Corynebacterium sp. H78 TaxID=3133417 RepID=UPI003094DE79
MTNQAMQPSPGGGLQLTPPPEISAVQPQHAGIVIPLSKERKAIVAKRCSDFMEAIEKTDPMGPEMHQLTDAISAMGMREMHAANASAAELLAKPIAVVNEMQTGRGAGGQSVVVAGIDKLKIVVGELDPITMQDDRSVLKRLLNKNPLAAYFAKFETKQVQLDQVIRELHTGGDLLRKENATIDGQRRRLWDAMAKLQEYLELIERLDHQMQLKIDELGMVDFQRSERLKATLLHEIRAKRQNLLIQIAVCANAYLGLDIVRQNNASLIRGVDEATTTTVSALRTAIMTAQSLANQKIVLDKVHGIRDTTSNLVMSTSQLLNRDGVHIQSQLNQPAVDMTALQSSFSNIYSAINGINAYRSAAADSMSATAGVLEEQLAVSAGIMRN